MRLGRNRNETQNHEAIPSTARELLATPIGENTPPRLIVGSFEGVSVPYDRSILRTRVVAYLALKRSGVLSPKPTDDDIVLRPLHDRGGALGVYSGPSGPIVTIAKINRNVSEGKPAGEDLPPDPLNDPTSP